MLKSHIHGYKNRNVANDVLRRTPLIDRSIDQSVLWEKEFASWEAKKAQIGSNPSERAKKDSHLVAFCGRNLRN